VLCNSSSYPHRLAFGQLLYSHISPQTHSFEPPCQVAPNQRIQHKMEVAGHALREKGSVSYAEPDSPVLFETPVRQQQAIVDLGEPVDEHDDEEMLYTTRRSTGRELRLRTSINLSLKASENGDKKSVSRPSVSHVNLNTLHCSLLTITSSLRKSDPERASALKCSTVKTNFP
jgi:hypothetical protein